MIFVFILHRYATFGVPAKSVFTFGTTWLDHVLIATVSVLYFFRDSFDEI